MVKGRVLILLGPTASGKTAVARAVASRRAVEILSADSRQIYRRLTVGTAKPSPAELAAVPHHFVDVVDPGQTYTAGDFGRDGRAAIGAILARGRLPLVVGGSGLYIRSLVDGLFEGPGADAGVRAALARELQERGLEALLEELRKVDPDAAARVSPTNPRRILRALEVYRQTGIPLSDHHRTGKVEIDFDPFFIGLRWERGELYRRIERRCREMLDQGLLREVESLRELGYGQELNALQTVGYAEAFLHLSGAVTYEEMVRRFLQNSRRYAKRQMTWFNADPRVHWIDCAPGDTPDLQGERVLALFDTAGGG
jgi:tRNA dimethylallyltransferase